MMNQTLDQMQTQSSDLIKRVREINDSNASKEVLRDLGLSALSNIVSEHEHLRIENVELRRELKQLKMIGRHNRTEIEQLKKIDEPIGEMNEKYERLMQRFDRSLEVNREMFIRFYFFKWYNITKKRRDEETAIRYRLESEIERLSEENKQTREDYLQCMQALKRIRYRLELVEKNSKEKL